MKCARLICVGLFLAGSMALWCVASSAQAPATKAEDLAASAQEVLRQHCFDCHGKDDKKPKGALKILDHTLLLKDERQIVIPRSPDKSKLIEVIEDGSMPSGKRPKVPEAQVKILRDWIAAGAPSFTQRGAGAATAQESATGDVKLIARVTEVFKKHCVECHGEVKPKAKLQILNRKVLLEKEVLVPGKAAQSELFKRVTATDETVMPPEKKPRMSKEEISVVQQWIAAGAPELATQALVARPETAARPGANAVATTVPSTRPGTNPNTPEATPSLVATSRVGSGGLVSRVKQIFRDNCFQCHGDGKPRGGVKILDRDILVSRKAVVKPGNLQESKLFEVINTDSDDQMPPPGQGRSKLKAEDIHAVQEWILAGAPAFPEELKVDPRYLGEEYILAQILEHVRKLPVENRPYVRYFSTNHNLGGGASLKEMDLQRDALALAINHLSWQRKLVVPQPVDAIPVPMEGAAEAALSTVFCVDIRELGWEKQPFYKVRNRKPAGASQVNLFDLALLEYPYALMYQTSRSYQLLCSEFLQYAYQVRPIPYVRADWFVSTATQPPLYEDFLLLPFDLTKLERILGVEAEANRQRYTAKRAGMTVSGVSRNNRVVERHPGANTAYYWLSFDFRTSRGRENMFKDPIYLNQTGGEVVFALPNGLQGYFVCDARGARLEAAPTDIVVDENAADRTVRNGLACMRCHEKGMKPISDDVRPALLRLGDRPGFDKFQALQLYPEIGNFLKDWKDDQDQFLGAVTKLLGKRLNRGRPSEPLIEVSKQYLDTDMQMPKVSAELGLAESTGLEHMFRTRGLVATGLFQLAAGGQVRRDMWEDYFDQVVSVMQLGTPVVPLDGLTRPDYQTNTLLDVGMKPNKKVYSAGDKLEITVANNSPKDICIELIGTSPYGEKVILVPSPYWIKAGQKYAYRHPQPIDASVGKEQITLYACDTEFPCGELLQLRDSEERVGRAITDRIVHPFYALYQSGGRFGLTFDPAHMVKKTIEIATQ